MASLKEIAADLGVSHALVSRVLNNNMGTTRVSEKTREAILRRARELDYEPNPLAVALKKGRKGAVGVFLHGIGVAGSELSARFIQSAGRALADHGLNLWLQFFEEAGEFRSACNEKLLRKLDGLIVAGLAHQDLVENLSRIEERGLPVAAACHGSMTGSGIVNYQVDAEAQCYQATKHLFEQGCRQVAHFYTSPVRYSGYLKAHGEAGLMPNKDLAIPARRYGAEDGRECMKRLLEIGAEFDGIVTQSDSQAAGALQYLCLTGVPKETWPRITGVDDSPIASHYSLVPLTSASAEMERCAHLAVEAIAGRLEGKAIEPRQVLPRLIVRESTVPGPAAFSFAGL
jgi:LacI family transcriptional regulator